MNARRPCLPQLHSIARHGQVDRSRDRGRRGHAPAHAPGGERLHLPGFLPAPAPFSIIDIWPHAVSHGTSAAWFRSTTATMVPGMARRSRPWIRQRPRCAKTSEAEGEIVLHAFPRMLGYVFNPVSFWVCHRHDVASVAAVLAEVNNTFGETHHYLLAHPHGEPLQVRRNAQCAQGVPRFSVLRRQGPLHVPLPFRRRIAGLRGSTISTARSDSVLLETHVSGRVQALTARIRAWIVVALSLVHVDGRRANSLACGAPVVQARAVLCTKPVPPDSPAYPEYT